MKQRWKAHNSKSLPETDVHHDGTLFVKIGYRLCPSHEFPPGNSCRQLVQNGNDWQQRTLPTVPREAKTTPFLFFAASSTRILPILQRRGSPDLLQSENERNYWQLKQKHVLQTGRRLIAPTKSLTTMFISYPKAHMESLWSNTGVFPGGEPSSSNSCAPLPTGTRNESMGILTDFKKEMQQTKLHTSHLVHIEVPVNALLLKHNVA